MLAKKVNKIINKFTPRFKIPKFAENHKIPKFVVFLMFPG